LGRFAAQALGATPGQIGLGCPWPRCSVALLSTITIRFGARRPTAEILQAELA